jgi:hypothetical protein
MLPAQKLSQWTFPHPDPHFLPAIPSHIRIPSMIRIPSLLDFPYPDLIYRLPIGIRKVDMGKSFKLLMALEKGL